MENQTANHIMGYMMIPMGLLGLLLASRAVDIEMEVFGWGLVVFATLFGFGVIKRHFDDQEAARVKNVEPSRHD